MVDEPRKPGRPLVIKTKPVVTESPVETVNTGVKEGPLVDNKPEKVSKGVSRKCKNHPKAEVAAYGLCLACFKKLAKVEKRKLYLTARLHGSNTHNYPIELRRAWRREMVLIDAGLWKRPLKTKAKIMEIPIINLICTSENLL